MADDEEIHNTTVRTVLGSSRREHRWDLAHEVDITTVLGKSFFDLRLARPMGEDDVEISIACYLGSVELLVPVGTRVTLEGSTFLAGASSDVSGEDEVPPVDDDGVDLPSKQLPRLDIAATAVLGRVRVRTPDRPDRVKPERFARLRRRKSKPKSTPAPQRGLADILADADDEEQRLAAARAANAAVVIDQSPPIVASAPIDADVVDRGRPESDPVDAEIARTDPETEAGPVDMTFERSVPKDDFDPADFPDDAPVAG